MSVTWVQDANSNYEISSVNHLLQLMHEGSLFTDAGTSPTSYLASNYIQTVDIDLASEHSNNVPIGSVSSGSFTSEYDGQGYSISNWSYTVSGSSGLFSSVNGGQAVVKNLVLDGVWVLLDGNNSGFLVGVLNNSAKIYNVTTNFSSGTRITGVQSIGLICGYAPKSSMSNITVGGIIDEFVSTGAVGGIVGFSNGNAPEPWTYLRNIATFTTGIQSTGSNAGGIAGHIEHLCSHVMNAMTGDIIGDNSYVGGIFGRKRLDFDDVVNSMRGNITTTGSGDTAAGISGFVDDSIFTRVLNYMTGDVEYGLVAGARNGLVEGPLNCTFSKCVVAMRGTTTHAAIASNTGTSEILLDTSYGIVSSFTNETITTMDVSSFDGVNADGLPFISFSSTDPIGNSINWDFVFGNTELFALSARPLSIVVSFAAVSGALSYRLTIQETGSSVATVSTGFTDLSVSANNLTPETEYTLRLFSTTDNSVYTQQYEDTVTTLANIPGNHSPSDFENEDGIFDISGNNTGTMSLLSTVINDVFTTGDEIVVSLPIGGTRTSTFVNQGDSYPIENESSLIIPFNADAGPSQTVFMILSNSSSVSVVYDEVVETVNIGGTVYSSGDSAIVDGRKMTVTNI